MPSGATRRPGAGMAVESKAVGRVLSQRLGKASGRRQEILENRLWAAGLGKFRQVWASGRRQAILEYRLWAAGLVKSRQVGDDRKSWPAKVLLLQTK